MISVSDIQYLRELAAFYNDSPVPEIRGHFIKLTDIANKLETIQKRKFGIRWTPKRKKVLCENIISNKISMKEACSIWGFSIQELHYMIASYNKEGINGIRVHKKEAV